MVLPAPGGPVIVVSGPRAPSAISLSTRGRATTQPGRVGTVILDIRIGLSAPVGTLGRMTPCGSVLIPIRIILSPGGCRRPAMRSRVSPVSCIVRQAGLNLLIPHPLSPLYAGEKSSPFENLTRVRNSPVVSGARPAVKRDVGT